MGYKIQSFVTEDLWDKFVKICKELGCWNYEEDKPTYIYRVVQALIKNYPLADSKEKYSADLEETSEVGAEVVEPEIEEEVHKLEQQKEMDPTSMLEFLEEIMKFRPTDKD